MRSTIPSHPLAPLRQDHPGAVPPADLPSAAEVLTIIQFGFPRSYHLNDGMGPDLACPGRPARIPWGSLLEMTDRRVG